VTNPELLEAIIRSATDYAIISFDGSNVVTSWSAGAETLLGWTAAEMLGQDAAVVFTPEDRERKVPDLERQTAIDTGRAEEERWHVRKMVRGFGPAACWYP
jgi:PAS domain S-box-containing protein